MDLTTHVRRVARDGWRGSWGLLVLGLVTGVIAGVLSMHAFAVDHRVPTDATGTSIGQHDGVTGDGAATHAGSTDSHAACPSPDCADHGTMWAAMCLFALLWLVIAIPPRTGSGWRWRPAWRAALPEGLPSIVTPPPTVSLVWLGISRT